MYIFQQILANTFFFFWHDLYAKVILQCFFLQAKMLLLLAFQVMGDDWETDPDFIVSIFDKFCWCLGRIILLLR